MPCRIKHVDLLRLTSNNRFISHHCQSERRITVSSLALCDDLNHRRAAAEPLSPITSPQPCGISLRGNWAKRRDAIIKHRQRGLFWVGLGYGCHQKHICSFFCCVRAAAEEWMSPATECLIGRGICLRVSRDLWRQLSRSSRAPSPGSSLIHQAPANTPPPPPFVFLPLVFGWESNPQPLLTVATAPFLEGNPLYFFFLLFSPRSLTVYFFLCCSTDGLHSKLWILDCCFCQWNRSDALAHKYCMSWWAWVTAS